jgi:hypothetical protein
MLHSYLKTAVRNLLRHNVSSAINVAGLSIGISAALVIYLIVHHEFSFDTFHPDGDRIYRVVSRTEFPDLTMCNSGVPMPTAIAIREEQTGIALATHFLTMTEMKVGIPHGRDGTPDVFRKQLDIIYADSDYFRMFDYQWLAGSPATALAEPFHVVLTESRASISPPLLRSTSFPER